MRLRTQPGHLHDSRSRKSSSSSLNEKGFIAAAIGVVLLISPYLLKGSASVNAVTTSLQPLGWGVLVLGLLLMGLHVLRQRGRAVHHSEDDAPVSRFQHTVLPEELLNPPTRIRLEPMDDRDEVWRNSSTDPSSTMPSTLDTVPASLDPDVAPMRHTPRIAAWAAQVYEQIEWRRFEAVCNALFTQAGFQPRAQSLGSTGGVDLWLHSRHAQDGPVALARCRHWLGRPVGVRELRDFHGKLSSHKLRRGSYVTSGGYTQEALEFAHAKGINLLDGNALLALIAKRRPEQQQTLLDIAYEGEYWRPSCASCGSKMIERGSEADSSAYWGCINYPRCRNILPMMYPL